ncbi:MAG: hypothetical protein P4M09_11855 [Devosia sp.]|nr:hypothetical protein [Devosia sp.]
MDETIASLNIERFQGLLAREADDEKQQLLRRLLVEEEEKLRQIKAKTPANSGTSGDPGSPHAVGRSNRGEEPPAGPATFGN